MSNIFGNASHDTLNPKQTEAVTLPPSNALILAGAGSGKTRVLVHRIAYLINHYGFSPYSILAVTFTNKAAQEMRHRIENLVGQNLWVGTFHGIAHRLLRMHWEQAHLNENFQVIDSEDQLRLIKRLLKEFNLDEKQTPPKSIQHFINAQKDEGRRADQIIYPNSYSHTRSDRHSDSRFDTETFIQIYKAYEALCEKSHLIDFADLLLKSYELFKFNPDLLTQYQDRFKALLVDEFQDTNRIQYLWLKILAGPKTSLLVVCDDDQSIYGWRGARVGNIAEFQKDFAPVKLIKLEQNYRSTQTILNAANYLIAHNTERLGKTLFSEDKTGNPISLFSAFNELEEAHFIASQIKQAHSQGTYQLQDFAVLYRSNAQSRVLEEALLMAGLNYRVYGGVRFFERSEIKTALAYCRLVFLREDDAAFERIINTPSRAIGEKTQSLIRDEAKLLNISLWAAALNLLKNNQLPGRASLALQNFIYLIEKLDREIQDQALYDQVEHIIKYSGLIDFYQTDDPSKAESRLENLGELVSAARTFMPENSEFDLKPSLQNFLSHAVLESGEGVESNTNQDAVQLMTVHASKGLEFPWVFISGLEEDLFPSRSSTSLVSPDNQSRLEEERRLMYVGMTRAMKNLSLTYAESRRLYGESIRHIPSRFLSEIPKNLIQVIRHKNMIRPAHSA